MSTTISKGEFKDPTVYRPGILKLTPLNTVQFSTGHTQ